MTCISFGRQTTGDLGAASAREWLVTDGLGGFAMGTVAGLRTRRYHGLLVVATAPPIGRMLGLAALDAVVTIGDHHLQLATHEWSGGAVSPTGHLLLDRFDLIDGVPRWTWSAGPLSIQMELAMSRGRPGVATVWTLLSAPADAVCLDVAALATWRDVHGERHADGSPDVAEVADGFVFEGAYRVSGPDFRRDGTWYHGVHHREEAARGLSADEDLVRAGTFSAVMRIGESMAITAWSGDLVRPLLPAAEVIEAARARARSVALSAGATDATDALLAHAADQFIVEGGNGPTVVAGYPWFGDWSRDTMTSYEGLFLDTGRVDEGSALLRAAASTVSEGMLANTSDVGGTEYNTVDAAMWFLHAVGRHVDRTGDLDLGFALLPAVEDIVAQHVRGTRFGIRVEGDGLVTNGADGLALTWMDARVDGRPITQRAGKPVEVNALWISGLDAAVRIAGRAGLATDAFERPLRRAGESFRLRFASPTGGLLDVADGPQPGDSIRPNQLIAAGIDAVGLSLADRRGVLAAIGSLRTSIGLRSLSPADPGFCGLHRGDGNSRDAAYHQGTVWPWLLGPLVDVLKAVGEHSTAERVVTDAEPYLLEWGLGSVSETADGDQPHMSTGCPFQAWSVAEWFRARSKCR